MYTNLKFWEDHVLARSLSHATSQQADPFSPSNHRYLMSISVPIDIKKQKNILLKVCYVPTTCECLPRLLFYVAI
jgi:hypothetical protein